MAAATKPEPVREEWIYAGKRVDAKDKLYDAWWDGTRELHYAKLTGSMPGHVYAVDVTREDGHVLVSGSPRYLAEQATIEATPKQIDTWRAEDRAARSIADGKRVEKQAKDDDELERALEVLRRHYSRLTTQTRKGAFTSYVIGELSRKPKEQR